MLFIYDLTDSYIDAVEDLMNYDRVNEYDSIIQLCNYLIMLVLKSCQPAMRKAWVLFIKWMELKRMNRVH